MSKHERTHIILSKYIVLLICSLILFLVCSLSFALISYYLCDKSIIYFNYKAASKAQIILNVLEINFLSCFYIAAISAFSLMLGVTFKRQGISLLLYIITVTIITTIFNNLGDTQILLPKFFFTVLSQVKYLGTPGYFFSKIMDIIPCISNVFIFLTISDYTFKNYEY